MRLIALGSGLSFDRFIIIPAKHFGSAVERNKIRRQAKELFRLYPKRRILNAVSEETNSGLDIVLVVYPGKVPDFSLLESQFYQMLDKIYRELVRTPSL